MAKSIKFDAEREAERVLEDVMQRRNWSVDLRDVLADRIEQIVLQAFKDAGINAVNNARK